MSGGREVVVSAVFTALLVVSILALPSLLLTGGGSRRWPFLAATGEGPGGGGGGEARYPVSFAYLISASTGDAARAARLLAVLYHPANSYLLHLDREAPAEEHRRLAELVSGPVYARVGNVWIVGRPNLVTYRGPTMLSTTLHAVAVLLRLGRRWDWFVNLSASDYPLVTQDDLMEAFSRLPRDLNFIEHTSHLGWKMSRERSRRRRDTPPLPLSPPPEPFIHSTVFTGVFATMTRHWMYNADRRSKEFIDGVHYFLRVAEANKRDGFMCCPCALCKNLKEYSSSRSLHSHLLKSGFMPNYICWTKHGETRVIMEEGEEEQLDPNDIIAQYGDFDDTAMGEAEEEAGAEDTLAEDDALGDVIRDAQRDCESEKEKATSSVYEYKPCC